MENSLNEFVKPWEVVTFPVDQQYKVNTKLCDSSREEYNERMAAFIAQKYDLEYRQGDGINTKTTQQVREIQMAHDELSKYMPVSKVDYQQEPISMYFFVFYSWEEK